MRPTNTTLANEPHDLSCVCSREPKHYVDTHPRGYGDHPQGGGGEYSPAMSGFGTTGFGATGGGGGGGYGGMADHHDGRGYDELLDTHSLHRFIAWNARVVDVSPEARCRGSRRRRVAEGVLTRCIKGRGGWRGGYMRLRVTRRIRAGGQAVGHINPAPRHAC